MSGVTSWIQLLDAKQLLWDRGCGFRLTMRRDGTFDVSVLIRRGGWVYYGHHKRLEGAIHALFGAAQEQPHG